ncbi:MAG TPA: hypothetical protein VMI54_07360 [Polyangiaceae bacterium]|nr:hypothetical protein [Polyangiaceae bacterium]
MHSVIVLRPRGRLVARGYKDTLREVFRDVLAFERNHARLAWGVTFAGFVLGLALRSLG